MRRFLCPGLLILVAGLSGCQKLNIESNVQVNPHEVKTITYDAPNGEQKVSIAFSSSGTPVSAYLVLEKNAAAASDQLVSRQKPASILSQSENTEQGTLEATIPAREGFVLLLSHTDSKAVEVNVKATGK